MTEQNNSHDMRWRKFPEEKPEKAGYFEVTVPVGEVSWVVISYFDLDAETGEPKWWFASSDDEVQVAHWRGGPLP